MVLSLAGTAGLTIQPDLSWCPGFAYAPTVSETPSTITVLLQAESSRGNPSDLGCSFTPLEPARVLRLRQPVGHRRITGCAPEVGDCRGYQRGATSRTFTGYSHS